MGALYHWLLGVCGVELFLLLFVGVHSLKARHLREIEKSRCAAAAQDWGCLTCRCNCHDQGKKTHE